jgi:5,5'-dehydrodivanillate O-demethylase oxygenase subunit
MATQEANDRLTQVGPGTPMGNLLRRYWQPIGTAIELEREPVQSVRLLGEDLTLFRSESGAYGLVGQRCAHRGLDLKWGIPQANGLRCAYHGWTYDVSGRTVETPFEPVCRHMQIPAYPVQEVGGMIFAYLGPEPVPLVPRYDLLVRDDLDRVIDITPLPCNWLQTMDNAADPVHFEHLHAVFGNYQLKKLGRAPAMFPARHVKIEFDVFDYGIMKRRLLEGEPETSDEWTTGHPLIFPNMLAVGSAQQASFQYRTPVDDTHTLQFAYRTTVRKPEAEPKAMLVVRSSLFREDGSIVADNIPLQDMLAWVEQGPVSDRTAEHLATSDKGVILYHRLLNEQMDRLERGEEPMAVVRDPEENEPWIDIRRERRHMTAFQPQYQDYFERVAGWKA